MANLSELEKKMEIKRKMFITAMVVLGLAFIILLPIISLFIGLILSASSAFKSAPATNLRPTGDIYSPPHARMILQDLAAEEYAKINNKRKNASKQANKRTLIANIAPVIVGFEIFITSLILLWIGFYGILFQLLSV